MALIDEIGGEDKVRELVEAFYNEIETKKHGAKLLILHQEGHGLLHARLEQFNFLCGFLGGRQHYLEKHHHMNLKLMHEHLELTHEHGEAWLLCMKIALEKVGVEDNTAKKMLTAFERVTDVLTK